MSNEITTGEFALASATVQAKALIQTGKDLDLAMSQIMLQMIAAEMNHNEATEKLIAAKQDQLPDISVINKCQDAVKETELLQAVLSHALDCLKTTETIYTDIGETT